MSEINMNGQAPNLSPARPTPNADRGVTSIAQLESGQRLARNDDQPSHTVSKAVAELDSSARSSMTRDDAATSADRARKSILADVFAARGVQANVDPSTAAALLNPQSQ